MLLTNPPSRLVTYTRVEVPVLGCLSVTVQHENTKVFAELYVVKTGTALLGLDLFKTLGLCIENNTVLSNAPTSPAVMSPAGPYSVVTEIKTGPVTTEKLGLAKGFIHQIKIREGVQPVQQKLRRLPLSVRQAVSEELEWLLDMDVIERIDASPWVSPIVVTLKKMEK